MRLLGANDPGPGIAVRSDVGTCPARVDCGGGAAIFGAITHEPTHVHGMGADWSSV